MKQYVEKREIVVEKMEMSNTTRKAVD